MLSVAALCGRLCKVCCMCGSTWLPLRSRGRGQSCACNALSSSFLSYLLFLYKALCAAHYVAYESYCLELRRLHVYLYAEESLFLGSADVYLAAVVVCLPCVHHLCYLPSFESERISVHGSYCRGVNCITLACGVSCLFQPLFCMARSCLTSFIRSSCVSCLNFFPAILGCEQKESTTCQSDVSSPSFCIKCSALLRHLFISICAISRFLSSPRLCSRLLHRLSYSCGVISRSDSVRFWVNCRTSAGFMSSRKPIFQYSFQNLA